MRQAHPNPTSRVNDGLLQFLPKSVSQTMKHVALVGTVPPRRCGIATFTADVRASFAGCEDWKCDLVAILDETTSLSDTEATLGISQHEPGDYKRAASKLNHLGVDVVNIQHEFGIFGGQDGIYILDFMQGLTCPIVVTLHTVIEEPSLNQRLVMAAILRRSDHVIVMAKKGLELLVSVYGADPARVSICPHGAPDVPFAPSAGFKSELDLEGRNVLLTFGLLSPGKGLETVIAALPSIVERHPETIYVILGATHPHLIKRSGEAYRETLLAQAMELGVGDKVRFVDAYVDTPLLLSYLGAADIYVTPYLNKAQITSGTLAYAQALGKPVVSTPYWHAVEVVDDTCGAIVAFHDAPGFAAAINRFLDDPARLAAASAVAYERGRPTIWSRSAAHYINCFEMAIAAQSAASAQVLQSARDSRPSLERVLRTTDSCGIMQHSSYGVANRAHGYCIDDNVRGLILVQRLRQLGVEDDRLDELERTYAAFVQHAWNGDTGRFRNFMGYDRAWLEAVGSEDSNGRAYWSLGDTARYSNDPELSMWAMELAKQVGPSIAGLQSLRARCFAMIGAEGLLAADPDNKMAWSILSDSADNLMERLEQHSHPTWTWFEPTLSYDNARLPQALLVAGNLLRRPDMVAGGLDSLSWLAKLQKSPSGHFRAVGSQTSKTPYAPPTPFDQQPIEACATVDACLVAYQITRQTRWLSMAEAAHAWFFGDNELGVSLSDRKGGCFDGLRPDGLNRNQGAESILALQMANAAIEKVNAPSVSDIGRLPRLHS